MSEAGMSMDFAGEDRERLAAMRKRQILVVEDEFVNREILKAYLEPEYEVLCAETGEEAREKIRAGFDTISLILLDLNLPDLHGMDILRWIREDVHFSKIPVIVMTSDKGSEVESLTIGAVDFITKPYPMPEVIRARVRRIIELNETRDLIRETSRDHLTGLFNREYFFHYAEQYDHFHGEEPTDAVVMDVNHFRMINERYGKAFADEVLRRIGIAVKAFVKQNGGVACRREADRFLVYCPHRTDYTALADEVAAAAGGGMKGKIRIRLGIGQCPCQSGVLVYRLGGDQLIERRHHGFYALRNVRQLVPVQSVAAGTAEKALKPPSENMVLEFIKIRDIGLRVL